MLQMKTDRGLGDTGRLLFRAMSATYGLLC